MANLTLSIDDHALALARKAAAERHTTVNALVRDFIVRLTDGITPDQQKAIDRMLHRAATTTSRLSGSPPTREQIYAERLGRWV